MRIHATTTCAALVLAGTGCLGALRGGPTHPQTAALAAVSLAPAPTTSPAAFTPAASSSSGGSLAVGTFVRGREPQLQFCYGETRAASPALAGSATVAVTLDAAGRVLAADVVRRSWSGGNGGATVEQCVLSKVRAWKFPAGDAEDGPDAHRAHSFAVIFTR